MSYPQGWCPNWLIMGIGPPPDDAHCSGIAKAIAHNRCSGGAGVRLPRMSTRFDIPEWLFQAAPPTPPADPYRVEALVNRFIAGKQEALFTAPDAFYRREAADAVDGAPAIGRRLQALRASILEQAADDGERAALGSRLDAHVEDALDGIGRHVANQRTTLERQFAEVKEAHNLIANLEKQSGAGG